MTKSEELKNKIIKLYKIQKKYLHNLNIQKLSAINSKIYELRQQYKAERQKERQAEATQTAGI